MSVAAEEQQRTLRSPASVTGRGLFTGLPVTATLRPAPADSGVQFRRTDLEGTEPIPATVEYLIDTPRHTSLKLGDAVVETVEHCLSAIAGLGVDNVLVELSNRETPCGDGSALPFVEAIQAAGLEEQDAPRRSLTLTEPVTVRDGDAMIAALPNTGAGLDLLYDLDYGDHNPIGRQLQVFALEDDSPYIKDIAPARTFALLEEAEAMRERGMFSHLSPKDMLVLGENGPIDNTLRFTDEPARHKLLDMIGDLSLIGRRLNARIVARKSGHALNHRLAREILEVTKTSELSGVTPGEPAMSIRQILRLLPHRYPMVLVDRVLEIEGDRRAVGVKNVTINEPFFQGHYPGTPIMPGVLIVEAMSQLAGLMLSQKLERTGKVAVLMSLDGVKIRRPVVPGDQLVMETEAIRASSRFGEVRCHAYVGGQLAAEALVKFMMVDAEQE
ncbi:MAG: UDP-3-O-[3-hydroxymyristoyl] N-acetylglucosamine deacetylase [Phycisphaeraceae bacterium]|nr:UDP-3-O-[3-hydroxymyristoyl] N-acetylglucosamine deacetylase [Phycisphaeraceae bacterium]MCB9846996.1 UDP-3-O-[3-hydroxymyristoyl] N-acetylglucosamine deacetylase [Phycisphaeraceae bacterium]